MDSDTRGHREKFLGTRWAYWVCLLLVLATVAVYWQVGGHEFIDYDDDLYVVENHAVRTGLNTRTIAWAFRTTYAANWHPLTWLSHLLDVELYGLNAGAHHLSSVLIHVVNTVLLFLLFYRSTGGLWPSAFAAALFGLHPLHVESVAQVAGRKDVLSTLFWLLAMLAYAGYVARRGVFRYVLMVLWFALGLMSKPMVVTLPFVLLLLDYWPLRRFEGAAGSLAWRRRFFALIREKIPLFLLTAASCLVTFMVQDRGGAVRSLVEYPLGVRAANALVSYVRYMVKTVWPEHLAVFYPHPGAWPLWQVAGAAGLLLLVSAAVVRASKVRPYLLVGWLWYLGTLVPVIGVVQVGSQAMADRYTYVPLIGLFVMLSWGMRDALQGWGRRPLIAAAAVAVVFIMAAVSWVQAGYWENSLRLFAHAIAATENNLLAQKNLGVALERKGRLAEAVSQYLRILEIDPHYYSIHNNIGNALLKRKRISEAENQFRKALQKDPTSEKALNNLANVLSLQGRAEEAVPYYLNALQIRPDYMEAHYNLGNAYKDQGNIDAALREYEKALEIDPFYKAAYTNLAICYVAQHKRDEAIRVLSKILRLYPEDPITIGNLESLLADKRKRDPE